MTVKVAVCDDHESQLHEAAETIERFAHDRRLDLHVSTFQSIESFFAAAQQSAFDIVFMDIEFDGKPRGIEAVRKLNETAPACQVVYLSNYLQYSVDVYRTDHVWFVLKSQFEERLPEVFEKLSRVRDYRGSFIIIVVKGGGAIRISCDDILYLERRSKLTRVVTHSETYETREKLAEIVAKLPADPFAYCHSSFVVNMPCIVELRDDCVQVEGGDVVPMSRRYARAFKARYFEWADGWTV